MSLEPLLWALAALLMGLGLAGCVLPMLPGAPLVFAGCVAAASIDRFARVGWPALLLEALLMAAALAVDPIATGLGARRVGASRSAVLGAVAGTLLGVFFGLPGLLLGPLAGAAAGEYVHGRSLPRAGRVGLGTWLGLAAGAVAKLGLAVAMIAVFVIAYVV